MDILLKKKDRLEHQLRQLKQKERDRAEYRTHLVAQAGEQKVAMEKLQREVSAVEQVLLEKKEKFLVLKDEVFKYKKGALHGIRDELRSLYKSIFEEASKAHFSASFSAFEEFTRVRDLIGRNVFRGLGRRLERLYSEEKEKLKKHILSQIAKKMQEKRKMHELVFNMKFLRRYEDYFSEDVMTGFLYERTAKGFEYHFMSDRDSNRLDKPEWFLDFILGKLQENREIFDIWEDVGGVELKGNGSSTRFLSLVTMTCGLVETKIDEVSASRSKQKRNLTLHLGVQVMKFRHKVFQSYGAVLEFPKLGKMLYKEQRKYVREKLSKIHEMRHVRWFDGYKELSRECLLYIYRFRELDSAFGMDDVIQIIVDYNRVFLESLRYINRQEIRVLCWVYSEFERFKGFLLDQESEVVFDSRLSMESRSVNVRKDRAEAVEDMLHEAVTGSIERISEFNSENLKLIMSLAMNDTEEGLKPVKRFSHDPNRVFRNLVVGVGRYLDDYRECLSYRAISHSVKERIDGFVLEEVVLKHRLESSEYFELVETMKRLKEMFGEEEWKSEVGLKCVGDIFEGRDAGEGPLSKMIKSLYV
ncbi:hypothetical protein [Encephalitozoon cuniculi GB-M1]|uniref:Uncharacterized protein n=1 Tax=Encephalitozoon cuniculi (strain GB-M1) TaxID=284813 RepID=Q8SUR6_ENCCU|nr:uncharacterized protein ECU08_0590 [Encephalitozoon cuniculi GB-M1]UYI26988.1 transport protein TIP20 [Encephalitozoon cuniculi]CAD26364.2 hypothetical protein [Encephalitozoon cuniculi GB-M1]